MDEEKNYPAEEDPKNLKKKKKKDQTLEEILSAEDLNDPTFRKGVASDKTCSMG